MHPLAEELNTLAQGIPVVHVAGLPHPCILRSHAIQFTADMAAIDILMNSTGSNGYVPNRAREFHGVYHAASIHDCFPPEDPVTGEVLFSVAGCAVPRRSAASLHRDADEVEDARSTSQTMASQKALSKRSGVKGNSLFFASSSAMRLAYPHLNHLWSIGPAAAPFDDTHLCMQNVAPML